MAVSNMEGFERVDIALSPFDSDPTISEDIQQTLTRLMAWNVANKRFELVRLNSDGSLAFTIGEGRVNTGLVTITSVGIVAVIILPSNSDRRYFSVVNAGGATVYIGFTSGVAPSTGYPIPPGGTFGNDVFYGTLYAVTSAGATDVRVLEH